MRENKSQFFSLIIDLLNSSGLKYCIMNGYEQYPEKIQGDIDIIVEDFVKFWGLIKKFSEKFDFRIVQRLDHGPNISNIFLAKRYVDRYELLSLDIYENYIVNSRVFFTNSWFLEDRRFYKGFYVPISYKAFFYYFVKKVIKGDLLKYIDKIFSEFELIKSLINFSFFDSYFKKMSNDIVYALSERNILFFEENLEELRKDLFNTVKPRFVLRVRNFKRYLKRLFIPTGFHIAILGPDGSGKTTIIHRLKDEELPFRRVDYFHLKPRVFDSKASQSYTASPHARSPHKGIKSYIKLVYFVMDYVLGYWLRIYPLKVRSSLIIFDRYYDDIYIDPKRYRYGGNLRVAKLLKRFIPEPDLYIILITTPNVILNRKQEVEFHELERQLEDYKMLVDGVKYLEIDAAKPVEELIQSIKSSLIENLSRRYE